MGKIPDASLPLTRMLFDDQLDFPKLVLEEHRQQCSVAGKSSEEERTPEVGRLLSQ